MTIADALFEYQEVAVETMARRRRQGLFDDPGSGKTIMALAAVERDGLFERPSNILVLATKTGAELAWMKDVTRWVHPRVTVVSAFDGSIAGRRRSIALSANSDAPTLVIGNHALIELSLQETKNLPEMWGITWDAIIIDESQLVLPSKADYDKDMTGFWRGLRRLQTTPMTLLYALSGTPDRGLLDNRYGTWRFLLPERHDSTYPYESWLIKNFHVGFKRFKQGRHLIETMYGKSVKKPDEWNEMDAVMTIRRTKAEIAPWLPPKRYFPVILPWPLALQKQHDAFVSEFRNSTEEKVMWMRQHQFAICEWTVTRKSTGGTHAEPIPGSRSPKRDWIIDWLKSRDFDQDDGKAQVVIASAYTTILKWLQGELEKAGYAAALLTGEQATGERLRIQRAFQDPDNHGARIILLSEDLGNSIDLDMADDLIFVDEPHDPDVATQVEDRCHRVSRNHNVFIWQLRTKGTIDENIAAISDRRFTTTRETYDGRRGVDFQRTVLAELQVEER